MLPGGRGRWLGEARRGAPGLMLSVRRRQEDAGVRVAAAAQAQQPRGGLRMDDDAELEEGEACGDDTAFVDPDVALSYIVSRSRRASPHLQQCRGSVPASGHAALILGHLPASSGRVDARPILCCRLFRSSDYYRKRIKWSVSVSPLLHATGGMVLYHHKQLLSWIT